MDHLQRTQRMDALRTHEEQASRLSRAIATLGGKESDERRRPDVILFTAQLMRHRISAALLAAELAAT